MRPPLKAVRLRNLPPSRLSRHHHIRETLVKIAFGSARRNSGPICLWMEHGGGFAQTRDTEIRCFGGDRATTGTENPPKLTVTARRLDSPATPLVTDEHANAGWTSDRDHPFIVTGIDIPTVGCWQITGD